jgi:hypothetical protein
VADPSPGPLHLVQSLAATARLTKALAEGRLVVIVDPDSTVRLASAARASYPGIVAAFAAAIAESAAAGTWPGRELVAADQD